MEKKPNWVVRFACTVSVLAAFGCKTLLESQADQAFDIVLLNGRVVDPESGLDAVRNVGIRDGRIASISESPIKGREVIDARGLVVAPGFIDLHAHGQRTEDARLQAQDGVTTALDMESGVYPVAKWYEKRAGTSPVHFGASAGYMAARMKLKNGIDIGHSPTSVPPEDAKYANEEATAEEVSRLLELIEQSLKEGALGAGMGIEYVRAASRTEILRVFQLAARHGACAFVHVRASGMEEPSSGLASIQEVIGDAAVTGACLHIVHVTSSALHSTPVVLEMINSARARGLDITTEVYPYTAASTRLNTNYFSDGWQKRLRISYADLQWAPTGERLTKETFEKYRKEKRNEWVVIHSMTEAMVDPAVRDPSVIIASDGIPFNTKGEHPRGAGTFSRVLGYYVRERGLLSLMDALRKMTLQPAQRLERFVPQMQQKGRIRVGADADITVFDAATIKDQATYDKPMVASAGIAHVLVNGTFVVRGGHFIEGVFPGKGIRRSSKVGG